MGIKQGAAPAEVADTISSLAQGNPGANPEEVGVALEALRELHANGVTRAGYNIRSPYGRSVTHSSSEGRWASR